MSDFAWLEGFDLDFALVLREGSSTRSADELKVVFISDAIDLIETLHDRSIADGSSLDTSQDFRARVYQALRSRAMHAEENLWDISESEPRRLTRDGFDQFIKTMNEWVEELNTELHKNGAFVSWFDTDENGVLVNQDMADPDELREDLESILSDLGLWTQWEDGFRIEVQHPDDCVGCDRDMGEWHEYEAANN